MTRVEGLQHDAASRVGATADAIGDAGAQLQDERLEPLAGAAQAASDRLSGFAKSIDTGTLDDLGRVVRDFARRSPGLFAASSAALGLVAARFLKASAPPSPSAARNGRGGNGKGAAARRASVPPRSGFGRALRRCGRLYRDHPVLMGVATLGTAAAIGALLPETELENDLAGAASDRATASLEELGRSVIEDVKTTAAGAAEAAAASVEQR